MPSAGRTSTPTSGPEPLTSTFDVTLRLAGSIVTIDLPSTRPIIQPAAWAPVATALDATTAPVSTSTFILANMGGRSLAMIRGCRAGKRPADATSYGAGETGMQDGSGFVGDDIHVFVRTALAQRFTGSASVRHADPGGCCGLPGRARPG